MPSLRSTSSQLNLAPGVQTGRGSMAMPGLSFVEIPCGILSDTLTVLLYPLTDLIQLLLG